MASKFFLLALFDVAFFIFSKFCPSAEDTRRTRARREASVLMTVFFDENNTAGWENVTTAVTFHKIPSLWFYFDASTDEIWMIIWFIQS